MIKFLNLVLAFLVISVFSPETSASGCADMVKKTEDCHACHSDNEQSESSEHHTEDNCAMACCHTALENTQVNIQVQEQTDYITLDISTDLQINIKTFSMSLFRPPIA